MDSVKNLLFSTPFQVVFNYLLQNPDLELSDADLTTAISAAKRAAIHQALRKLNNNGISTRRHEGRRCLNKLNPNLPWIAPLKIVSNILDLDPFVSKIRDKTSKIVLFGSRADGSNRHDSDYDLLIISTRHDDIIHASIQDSISDKLQLIVKTPEALLDFDSHEPVLAASIRKGIILWER